MESDRVTEKARYIWHRPGFKGNDRGDRLAGKAALTSGWLLGRFEVLRSLRHYLRAQSRGHHTIDHPEERGVEKRKKFDDLP